MNDELITKLTEEYYQLVSRDHHKDRDCHWYINKVWSYGDPPLYRVEHFGYCYSEVKEDNVVWFKTYETAELSLIFHLTSAIAKEKSCSVE